MRSSRAGAQGSEFRQRFGALVFPPPPPPRGARVLLARPAQGRTVAGRMAEVAVLRNPRAKSHCTDSCNYALSRSQSSHGHPRNSVGPKASFSGTWSRMASPARQTPRGAKLQGLQISAWGGSFGAWNNWKKIMCLLIHQVPLKLFQSAMMLNLS